MMKGNTPTGVGKTSPLFPIVFRRRKHPHGRGEDRFVVRFRLMLIETPPRAWGRLYAPTLNLFFTRNTPTGVGKTSQV